MEKGTVVLEGISSFLESFLGGATISGGLPITGGTTAGGDVGAGGVTLGLSTEPIVVFVEFVPLVVTFVPLVVTFVPLVVTFVLVGPVLPIGGRVVFTAGGTGGLVALVAFVLFVKLTTAGEVTFCAGTGG
jgi:hypothetical protein